MWTPVFECVVRPDGERVYRVGHELVDEFLEFVSGRSRPSTVRAYAHDLKIFFGVVRKDPVEVTPADVLAFVVAQNRPRDGAGNVVRISDGRAGLSASTIKRRLAAVSSLYGYLVARGDVGVASNPVPRGLPTRKSRHRGGRGLPLDRGVRRLPRILDPGEVEALMGALRMSRNRAMVQAMVLGGLRRCEVLGLRLEDLRLGEWRVFIADGKGGHQRLVRSPDASWTRGSTATVPPVSATTPAGLLRRRAEKRTLTLGYRSCRNDLTARAALTGAVP